jgi:hypothetical protein
MIAILRTTVPQTLGEAIAFLTDAREVAMQADEDVRRRNELPDGMNVAVSMPIAAIDALLVQLENAQRVASEILKSSAHGKAAER